MKRNYFYLLSILLIFSCSINSNLYEAKKIPLQTYTGWWVYGSGEHIFKDSITLEEWEIFFINEDKEDAEELYLEITQMEYFALECIIKGVLIQSKENKIIEISSFEITHIEGCGEN
tara:strand:- start:534 stop:884 length:351 start_codon:yes stop_codon:yes gene_type:complete